MRDYVARECTTGAYYLGEGCRWDEERHELYWVSIYDGQFFRARADGPDVEVVRRYDLGGEVGAVAPCARRVDGWILARTRSIYRLDVAGGLDLIARLDVDDAVRVNDAAADPWGAFWVGTMAYDGAEGRGSLFRYSEQGGLTTVLEGLTISNGLGWSRDRRTMYLVDSGPALIYALDVDDEGAVSHQRILARFDAGTEGSPDGLCVDADDAIWVAMWGGGAVLRLSPSGEVLARVSLPASQPSSCALGGANATTLYVTTAREDLSEADLADQPTAGRLFCVDVGVRGRALDAFAASDR